MITIVIWDFCFQDLSHIENLSEIKPPLHIFSQLIYNKFSPWTRFLAKSSMQDFFLKPTKKMKISLSAAKMVISGNTHFLWIKKDSQPFKEIEKKIFLCCYFSLCKSNGLNFFVLSWCQKENGSIAIYL